MLKFTVAVATFVCGVSCAQAETSSGKPEKPQTKSSSFLEIKPPPGLNLSGKPALANPAKADPAPTNPAPANQKVEIIKPPVRGDIAALLENRPKPVDPALAAKPGEPSKPEQADKAPIPVKKGDEKPATGNPPSRADKSTNDKSSPVPAKTAGADTAKTPVQTERR